MPPGKQTSPGWLRIDTARLVNSKLGSPRSWHKGIITEALRDERLLISRGKRARRIDSSERISGANIPPTSGAGSAGSRDCGMGRTDLNGDSSVSSSF